MLQLVERGHRHRRRIRGGNGHRKPPRTRFEVFEQQFEVGRCYVVIGDTLPESAIIVLHEASIEHDLKESRLQIRSSVCLLSGERQPRRGVLEKRERRNRVEVRLQRQLGQRFPSLDLEAVEIGEELAIFVLDAALDAHHKLKVTRETDIDRVLDVQRVSFCAVCVVDTDSVHNVLQPRNNIREHRSRRHSDRRVSNIDALSLSTGKEKVGTTSVHRMYRTLKLNNNRK